MVKNYDVCKGCVYKNVRTELPPCCACKTGNLDHLVEKSKQASKSTQKKITLYYNVV